jgi:hypothetical protein
MCSVPPACPVKRRSPHEPRDYRRHHQAPPPPPRRWRSADPARAVRGVVHHSDRHAALTEREVGVLRVLYEHFRQLHQRGYGTQLSRDNIASLLGIEPEHVRWATHVLVEKGLVGVVKRGSQRWAAFDRWVRRDRDSLRRHIRSRASAVAGIGVRTGSWACSSISTWRRYRRSCVRTASGKQQIVR